MVSVVHNPEGLLCPECWSDIVYDKPEFEQWDTLSKSEKNKIIRTFTCAVCNYPHDIYEDYRKKKK